MVLLVIRCTNEIYFNPIPHVSYPLKDSSAMHFTLYTSLKYY